MYSGELVGAEGQPPLFGEVWVQGSTVVLFEHPGRHAVALHDATLTLDDTGRLVFTGTGPDGPTVWTARIPPRPHGAADKAKVHWPGEPPWEYATLNWTQYAVTVTLRGQAPRVLAGASVRTVGDHAYVALPGEDEITVKLDTRRSCCGG